MPLRLSPSWIWLLVSSWLATLALPGAVPDRPNVLIILADDLGYSDLGCYGGEISTPALDALAQNGLRFTQAYNTARCWPSRASVMTGYYAQQVRRDAIPGSDNTGGNRGTRPVWAPLLSEILKTSGYRTYHSGKWHIDGQPLALGFDRSFEIKGRGQSQYFSSEGNTVEDRPQANTPDYYATTAVADHAVQALQEHAAHFSSQPFFHYVCFTAPHFPLHAPAADIARYRGRYDEGWNTLAAQRHARQVKLELANHPLPLMEEEVGPPYAFPKDVALLGPNEVIRPLPWSTLTPEQQRFQSAKMEIHAAMIDRMDREIGRIVTQLRELNLLENTVIIFASDNGASAEIMVRGNGHDRAAAPGSASTFLSLGPGWSSAANTPFRRHKTWVHEGGISTPLIVHWPAGIAARGELRRTPIHLMDLFPTALELAGVKPLKTVKGVDVPPAPSRSVVPAFRKDLTQIHDSLWWLHEGNRALRVGDWKLVATAGGPWELYDLARDRGESDNVASKHSERVQDMADRWTQQLEEIKAVLANSPSSPSPNSK